MEELILKNGKDIQFYKDGERYYLEMIDDRENVEHFITAYLSERNNKIDDMQELFDAYERGGLTEAFGTGTAAVISPVGEMEYQGKSMVLNDHKIGNISQEMYDTLVGIQRGDLPDIYGWTVKLN